MERAGFALGKAIGEQFPEVGTAVAYIGKGHNAGDALIALRVLQDEFGWEIGVRAGYAMEQWAELTRVQWGGLCLDRVLEKGFEKRVFGPLLLIDGLLGIGAKGGLREPLAGLAHEIAELRNQSGSTVLVVDNPSGVDPDSGEVFDGAVVADRTFMIGAAKRGLLFAHAANATGALALVEVDGLSDLNDGEMELICPQSMTFGKSQRPFDFHKGKAGRVGIVAGSPSFTGAALISVLGAVRAGAGLVTLYARRDVCEAIRVRLPLEAMLKPCDDPAELLGEKLDSIVVGPGLGEMSESYSNGLLKLMNQTTAPVVVDADGLNLISRNGFETDGRHLLTPHPGEFARLAPELDGKGREDAARAFVGKCESVLLLKGARTIVGRKNELLRINSTGTPAMSNGGQGDLLSGVLGALLAGGMENFDAAALGAWLCGHAAELSVAENGDVCTATDTAVKISEALRAWRRRAR
jgi:NAD(P)H-hydrate epimerase